MEAVRHPVEFAKTHPSIADSVLAGIFITVSVVVGLTTTTPVNERDIGALGWLLIVGMALPISFRRTRPVPAMWAVLAATMPYWVLNYADDPTGPSLLVAIYSVGAHVDKPRSLRHGAAAVTTILSIGLAGVVLPEEDLPWFALPAFLVMYGTAWILGDNLRTRRAYLRELELTAAHGEAKQLAEAERAVAEERTRIARELHDVVAHSLSVMVVQAGAARRVLQSDPERASVALAAIESTGRESLNEMRRILGVLRSDDEQADLAPPPSLDDFGRLIDQCENAGLPVEITVEGDSTSLPASLEASAYRVVQEGLTNALKHAGPASAAVRLVYHPDILEVHVNDDGRGASTKSSSPSSGQGLIGMRERVEAFGGTLTAGPRRGGGYAVSATFPLGSSR